MRDRKHIDVIDLEPRSRNRWFFPAVRRTRTASGLAVDIEIVRDDVFVTVSQVLVERLRPGLTIVSKTNTRRCEIRSAEIRRHLLWVVASS